MIRVKLSFNGNDLYAGYSKIMRDFISEYLTEFFGETTVEIANWSSTSVIFSFKSNEIGYIQDLIEIVADSFDSSDVIIGKSLSEYIDYEISNFADGPELSYIGKEPMTKHKEESLRKIKYSIDINFGATRMQNLRRY